MKSKFLFLFIFLLSFSFISALDLSINNITVDKVYGIDLEIPITIVNNQNLDFYNVTFEDNSYIEMNEINKISANTNKTVTATIKYDNSINIPIRIKGFYLTNVGISNEVFNVNVSYPNGANPCSFTLIKGDKIIFKNTEDIEILMRDANSLENIHIFTNQETWEWSFDQPRIINYRLLRNGYPFGSTCQLSVLDSEGYVNNPNYDAVLNLSLNVNYPNTNLNANFPRDEYTISLLNEQEGYIEVINNGNDIAKNINITGEWFSFSPNLFDLEPGYSRLVAYTISPLGFIQETNQTNQSYTKVVRIDGNFDPIIKEFDIFVEHSEVSVGETSSSKEDFLEWLKRNYPELLEPKVIIQYVDENTKEYNVTTSDEKMDGLAGAIFDVDDSVDTLEKITIEKSDKLNQSLTEVNKTNQYVLSKIEEFNKEITKDNDVSISVVLAIIFIMIIAIGAFILTFLYRRDKYKTLMRWDNSGRQ